MTDSLGNKHVLCKNITEETIFGFSQVSCQISNVWHETSCGPAGKLKRLKLLQMKNGDQMLRLQH